jgi:hypothetical protein
VQPGLGASGGRCCGGGGDGGGLRGKKIKKIKGRRVQEQKVMNGKTLISHLSSLILIRILILFLVCMFPLVEGGRE